MTQNIFLDSTTAAKNDQVVGAPKVGKGSDYQLATYAFNAIMSLSRASTRGSYSRIEGVTSW